MAQRLRGQTCRPETSSGAVPLGPHLCLSLQFLAYDTQLVLGNRKHTISPEDYITGALQIYTDIIYIFTFVLQLVGSRD